MYESDDFFKIVTAKANGECSNFSLTKWAKDVHGRNTRKMHYEFGKTVAFSKYNVAVEQEQNLCLWSVPGSCYG